MQVGAYEINIIYKHLLIYYIYIILIFIILIYIINIDIYIYIPAKADPSWYHI